MLIRVLGVTALLGMLWPTGAGAQAPASPHCAAVFCEAGAIHVAALDSLRTYLGDTLQPPRVLDAVYVAPFKPLHGPRPAAVASFADLDASMLKRRWPDASIVDSADVVTATGALRPGGSLFVVSPIDWMGAGEARLEIARYPDDWNVGEQFHIRVQHGPAGWHAVRVDVGWQN
jgi:hypothetical protein